jgi:hypothetical protein
MFPGQIFTMQSQLSMRINDDSQLSERWDEFYEVDAGEIGIVITAPLQPRKCCVLINDKLLYATSYLLKARIV